MVRILIYCCIAAILCEIVVYWYDWRTFDSLKGLSLTPASSNHDVRRTEQDGLIGSKKLVETKETLPDAGPAPVSVATPEELTEAKIRQQQLASEEYSRLRTVNETIRLQVRYGRLLKYLNLSGDVGDKFIQMLFDRAHLGEDLNTATRDLDPGAAINAVRGTRPVLQQQWEHDLRQLLGEEGYKTFNQYEKNLGGYLAVTQVQQTLSNTGQNLTDSQADALAQILIANSERTSPDELALRVLPPDVDSDERGRVEIAGQHFVALQAGEVSIDKSGRVASNKLVSEAAIVAASGILKPAQLDALRRVRIEQLDARALAAKLFPRRTTKS